MMFTRFVAPVFVAVVIACSMLARHNAQEWNRLYADASAYYEADRYAECLEAVTLSLDHARGWLGVSALYEAESLNLQGLSLNEFGRYEEAETAYRRALILAENALTREGNDLYALVLNNFALSCIDQGRYVEAEAFAREALAIWEQLLSEDRGRALIALAVAMDGLEDYPQVIRYARAAAAVFEAGQVVDTEHLAVSLHWEGYALYMMDQEAQAEAPLLRALELYREVSPSDLIYVSSRLADVYLALGRVEDAEAQYLQTLAFFEGAADAVAQTEREEGSAIARGMDMLLSWALINCGSFYMGIERYDEAVPHYRRAVDIVERIFGTTESSLVSRLNDLGVACEQSGYYAEAEGAYLRALDIVEGWELPDTDVLFIVLQNLRDTYEKRGKLREMADIQQRMHNLTSAEPTAAEPLPAASAPAG